MADIAVIVTRLAEAKAAEARAKAAREAIERELAVAIGVPETWTGSTTSEICGFKVTCTRRDNIRIDADAVRGIIAESAPLEVYAQQIFRWKPEIDKKGWDAAPDEVIKAFSAAITRTPGKISFSLKPKEDKK